MTEYTDKYIAPNNKMYSAPNKSRPFWIYNRVPHLQGQHNTRAVPNPPPKSFFRPNNAGFKAPPIPKPTGIGLELPLGPPAPLPPSRLDLLLKAMGNAPDTSKTYSVRTNAKKQKIAHRGNNALNKKRKTRRRNQRKN